MYKVLAALMMVLTLIGGSIIVMWAQVHAEKDGGNWISQIPAAVYILLLAAVVISAWVFSLDPPESKGDVPDQRING